MFPWTILLMLYVLQHWWPLILYDGLLETIILLWAYIFISVIKFLPLVLRQICRELAISYVLFARTMMFCTFFIFLIVHQQCWSTSLSGSLIALSPYVRTKIAPIASLTFSWSILNSHILQMFKRIACPLTLHLHYLLYSCVVLMVLWTFLHTIGQQVWTFLYIM